jgi:formimidoylglutamate deiminase
VFSISRAAIRDVVVGGKLIVANGQHALQQAIVEEFANVQKKLWAS